LTLCRSIHIEKKRAATSVSATKKEGKNVGQAFSVPAFSLSFFLPLRVNLTFRVKLVVNNLLTINP